MNANMDELFQYQNDDDESSEEEPGNQPANKGISSELIGHQRPRVPPRGRVFVDLGQQKPSASIIDQNTPSTPMKKPEESKK